MIYTMTCNPSLDYIVTVDDFQLGKTNRTQTEKIVAGGKGINVSMVLQNLDIANIALGFVTVDFTGVEFLRQIQRMNVKNDFVSVANGTTRINMKLKNIEGTEINGKGPSVTKEEQKLLFAKLDLLQQGDTLILSGSIPNDTSDIFYGEIMKRLQDKGVLVIVDATKNLLEYTLPYQPFLIKPNNHELGELFGVELATRKDVIPYAKKMQEMGARNVLVSMAGEGAVFLAETGEVYQMEAPKGTLVYGGGAGDSMVAGFVAGWIEKKDYYHSFKMGISAGSATAFSEGLATKEVVEAIYRSI